MTSKEEAVLALSKAISSHQTTTTTCQEVVQSESGIQESFTVVTEHLPFLLQVLENIMTHIDSESEEQQDGEQSYDEIIQVADNHCRTLQLIAIFFDSIKGTKGKKRTEQYELSVRRCGGRKLEEVMRSLLEGFTGIAREPFVTAEQIEQLGNVLKEVNKLISSREENKRGVNVVNNGPGPQFYHGGHGHQNFSSGGLMVTGDNCDATYNYSGGDSTKKP